jgi:hypothetical protein
VIQSRYSSEVERNYYYQNPAEPTMRSEGARGTEEEGGAALALCALETWIHAQHSERGLQRVYLHVRVRREA